MIDLYFRRAAISPIPRCWSGQRANAGSMPTAVRRRLAIDADVERIRAGREFRQRGRHRRRTLLSSSAI